MDHVLPYGDRGAFQYLPYDERAPLVFDPVTRLITQAAPRLAVEHVGSTAVPGCPGKGFIDLLVMVPTAADLIEASHAVHGVGSTEQDYGQGYPCARGVVSVCTSLFRVHIQIAPRDAQKAQEMIAFRELLRHDPELTARYASRKQALIDSGHDRNPAYTERKSEVIRTILSRGHAARDSL